MSFGFGDIQRIISGVFTMSQAQKIALQKNVIPKVTTTQRGTIAGGDLYEGLIVHNLTTHKLNVYTGSAWEAVTSA